MDFRQERGIVIELQGVVSGKPRFAPVDLLCEKQEGLVYSCLGGFLDGPDPHPAFTSDFLRFEWVEACRFKVEEDNQVQTFFF